jgi:hypothetical protein
VAGAGEQGRTLHGSGAALAAGPASRDLQEGIWGHGELVKDTGVRAVRPPPRWQGLQVPQHEGHVGLVLRRRDVCHVHGRRSGRQGRPRAALAEQAKGPGCRHQEGHCPAGPGSPGRRDAPDGHLRASRGRDGNSVFVSLAHAAAHFGAYPGFGPQAEAQRGTTAVIPTPPVRPVQKRRVSVNPEFATAYTVQEPPSEVEGGETSVSVSVPALSGPEHAAAHPSVTHITDTLVQMGYLEDMQQKRVFLL